MLFSVLFVGNEHLLRRLVWASAQRLGAEWAWEGGVQVSVGCIFYSGYEFDLLVLLT